MIDRELSNSVVAIGQRLFETLNRDSSLFRSIIEGRVGREAYIAWLTQQHKYMRWTHELLVRFAARMSADEATAPRGRFVVTGADRHAEEERGHDDRLLDDLAELWGCTRGEALARVDATPTAPAVQLYGAIAFKAVDELPRAFAGFSMAIEVLAGRMATLARDAMLANRPFEGVERAIRIFEDHLEDGDHVEGGRLRLDTLTDPADRTSETSIRGDRRAYRSTFVRASCTIR